MPTPRTPTIDQRRQELVAKKAQSQVQSKMLQAVAAGRRALDMKFLRYALANGQRGMIENAVSTAFAKVEDRKDTITKVVRGVVVDGGGAAARSLGVMRIAGGAGSGNFGHGGRPGEVGGSSTEGGSIESATTKVTSVGGAVSRNDFIVDPSGIAESFNEVSQRVENVKKTVLEASRRILAPGETVTSGGITFKLTMVGSDRFWIGQKGKKEYAYSEHSALEELGKPYRDLLISRGAGELKGLSAALERVIREMGGAGSGNFGHAGRPGEVGGSGEGANDALARYTGTSYDINPKLRSGEVLTDEQKHVVTELDQAFKNAEYTKESITLYRGIPKEFAPEFQKGKSVLDAGFVSTSKDSKYATDFIEESWGKNAGMKMEIFVPVGRKILDVNAIFGKVHETDYQHEVLIPRGSRFYVDKVDRKNNTVHVILLP
jgi:hypothetical protein